MTDDYIWDVGAGLPQVLQDSRTQGGTTTTTTHLYGLGLIATTDSAGTASYYLADGLGSTTQLVDAGAPYSDRSGAYDRAGNSYSLGSDVHQYDVHNRLSQMNTWTGAYPMSTYYDYDASGEMVRRNVEIAIYPGLYDSKDTFIGGIYEEHSTACGAAESYTKYYVALGRVIAQRTGTITNGVLDAGDLSYLLADHLGTTTDTISAVDGSVISSTRYWPFGATRSGTPEERGYTGQQIEGMSTLGAYYYRARFYSSALAHFVSADSLAVDGLARYEYGRGNPIRHADPSGRCVQDGNGGWLECSRGTMVRYFSCAWGGQCDAGDQTNRVREYARGVIQTLAFKYFVAIESFARGDILLRLQLGITIKGAGRKIPGYPHDDRTGNVHMSVDVNATKREYIYADAYFTKANGIGGYLDGWEERRYTVSLGPSLVSLVLDAGPMDIQTNPFALSDFHAHVAWDLWFERDGALGQELVVAQEGGALHIIPDNVPLLDDLLVGSSLSLTVSEIPVYAY